MIRIARWWILTGVLALCATPAFAQQMGGVTGMDWKEALATLVNTAGVMLAVQGIKYFRPYLADKYGWALPILAMILGPLVATGQAYLAAKLGYQIDFSLITAALTGAGGVAVNQIYRQAKEGPTGLAKTRP